MRDLIDFEKSDFKELIGLDKGLPSSRALDVYRKVKQLPFTADLIKTFKQRFKILTIDFQQYDFRENQFSLIICNNVLHFFDDETKWKWIEIFQSSLQVDGLLFIRLNHKNNKNITESSLARKIDNFRYENVEKPEEVFFLVDETNFHQSLKNKFKILDKFSFIDDRTVSAVITR